MLTKRDLSVIENVLDFHYSYYGDEQLCTLESRLSSPLLEASLLDTNVATKVAFKPATLYLPRYLSEDVTTRCRVLFMTANSQPPKHQNSIWALAWWAFKKRSKPKSDIAD